MQPNLSKPENMVDRLATLDEICAAISLSSELLRGCRGEFPREIAADVGGYIRISSAEFKTALLVEDLIRVRDAQSN